jgi:hypothetical protein
MITMVLVFINDVAVVIDCNFLNNYYVVAVIIPVILTFYSVCKRGAGRVLILPIVTIMGSIANIIRRLFLFNDYYQFIIISIVLVECEMVNNKK